MGEREEERDEGGRSSFGEKRHQFIGRPGEEQGRRNHRDFLERLANFRCRGRSHRSCLYPEEERQERA